MENANKTETPNPSKIRGIIFDVDGTLIDSNDAHALAWVEAIALSGIFMDFKTVRPCIGMGGDKLLPAVAGLSVESEKGKRISQRRGKIFREKYLPHLKPFRGTVALLEKLKKEDLRLAIATSASREDLRDLLKVGGLEKYFEEKASAADAENSKPDPDIILAAAHKLDLSAQSLVMIGDTHYDIEAAAKLAIPTIAFLCGGSDEELLAPARAIYSDPQDLLDKFDTSPLRATT